MATVVRGGAAIGAIGGFNGTLGCLVTLDGTPMILGSAHVMSRDGRAGVGEPILALGARGVAGVELGKLAETGAEIDFTPGALNGLDAALATVTVAAQVKPGVGAWTFAEPDLAFVIGVDTEVKACGAVSGERQSTIADIAWSGDVTYDDGRTAGFTGLIRCEPALSAPGDSGAAVLTLDNRFVGVVLGGGEGFSLFCPSWMLRARWPGLKVAV
jgi:hypothetical protein